jgi:Fe-S cluster biosynthesis and repair protein YggX
MPLTAPCARCGRPDAPSLDRAPLPGKTGQEIQQRVCLSCWGEWQNMEVMVINELKLNFMDPASNETLTRHMREFLFPADPAAAPVPFGDGGVKNPTHS